MTPRMPTILTVPTAPTTEGRGDTGRFMNFDDWQKRNPDKDPSEYMTDEEGNPIDSRSDASGSGIRSLNDELLNPSNVPPAQYDLEQGGMGLTGGRKGNQSRRQMVTTTKKASILDPNP